MRKRDCRLIMIATLVLALGIPVIKGETAIMSEVNKNVFEEITPRYTEINTLTAYFDISGTKAEMTVKVTCSSSKKVSIKMILQRKDGDSWANVQTWNKTGTGNQTLSKSMVVTDGRKYRMKYIVTAGSETITEKTAAKTA